ncbi:hypothetical protein Plim_3602 [Planctopirus limnophila DSM 3776]|uniref:Uncharacterized protein n=1 Tax=Planctopirus limnophila (strain ATCC 43296 / DSM 3776 / IFAM 1008 / Mu 290) TaxID=521674 RepID=D5SVQ5_PLAL2|nr:hypothetical protein Plim_3602 [Planctopirus limnophila DSM 3776]
MVTRYGHRLIAAGWQGSDVFIRPLVNQVHQRKCIRNIHLLLLTPFVKSDQRQTNWGQTRTFDPSHPVGFCIRFPLCDRVGVFL